MQQAPLNIRIITTNKQTKPNKQNQPTSKPTQIQTTNPNQTKTPQNQFKAQTQQFQH